MKKWYFIAGAVVLLSFGIFLWRFSTIVLQDMSVPEIAVCYKGGGSVRELGGCGDVCDVGPMPKMCALASTYACSCGSDECWDQAEDRCVSSDRYAELHTEEAWAQYPLLTIAEAKMADEYSYVRLQGQLTTGVPLETSSTKEAEQEACAAPLVIRDASGIILVWHWATFDEGRYFRGGDAGLTIHEFFGTVQQPNETSCAKNEDECHCSSAAFIIEAVR